MPLISFNIRVFGATDIGLKRQRNEDAFLINEEHKLFAIADGLGGLPEGQIASSTAMEKLGKFVQSHIRGDRFNFPQIFSEINAEIYQKGHQIDASTGIGTTLTTLHVFRNQMFIGHAGDSGVLLLRDQQLKKLTKDHTVAQEIYDNLSNDRKETSIPFHLHHMLTRCLGVREDLMIDQPESEIITGDRILLYTDGVTKTASPHEIKDILSTSTSPEEAVSSFIDTALRKGGPDNTTAIVLFVL